MIGIISISLLTALSIGGSILSEYKTIKIYKDFEKNKNKKPYRSQLKISVVVLAYNNQETINNTIKSIINSSYRKYEVIVFDFKSKDNTRNEVNQIIEKYPKQQIRLVKNLKYNPERLKINLNKYTNGDVVLVVNAESVLDQGLMKKLSIRFKIDEKVQAIELNTKSKTGSEDLSSLAKDYTGLMLLNLRLYRNKLRIFQGQTISSNLAFRREFIKSASKPVSNLKSSLINARRSYAPDLYVSSDKKMVGQYAYSYSASRVRVLCLLLAGLICFVFVYYALASPGFFSLVWLFTFIYLISTIINNGAFNVREKVGYLLHTPIALFLIIISSIYILSQHIRIELKRLYIS